MYIKLKISSATENKAAGARQDSCMKATKPREKRLLPSLILAANLSIKTFRKSFLRPRVGALRVKLECISHLK